MRVRDLVSETVVSLTANKGRSALTILGIVVGIAAVIVMVALGQGTQTSITSTIESIGSNLVMVTPGAPSRGMMSAGATDDGELTLGDARAIAALDGVVAVAPQASSSAVVSGLNDATMASITGTSEAYPKIRNVKVGQGLWFTRSHDSAASKVAVLGADTSDTLFGAGSNPVGQRIRIDGVSFTVLGVTDAAASGGMNGADVGVYVPLSTLQRYLSGQDTLSLIHVEAQSQEVMDKVSASIDQALLARHAIADSADADFSIVTQKDLLSTVSTVTTLMTVFLGAVAGISLLVGGIGIMNMMLTTVTERIQEIGLRRAVGAKRRDISSQFLSEAVALTVLGGIIGLALGWGVSAVVTALSTLTAEVSWETALLAVAVSTGIGILFGYYPARSAARLDAIEALRYQ
ncbi:MAG: ABC transporter permease [Coriobacteriia bacterium]